MTLDGSYMSLNDPIYVAGHKGLVGSAISRELKNLGYINIQTSSIDLRNANETLAYFLENKPKFVFMAAAKVGGIHANSLYPADFLRNNILIQTNIVEASFQVGVERLLFLGSSCIYPKLSPQPIRESYLLDGPLEPTNRAYAVAKIAGIEMCWSYNRQHGTKYLAAMPTNLYGPGDNFHPENSHVLPALIRRFTEAKLSDSVNVEVWGSGEPRRELLFSDDLAQACVFLLGMDEARYQQLLTPDEPPLINIGTGEDVSIAELARMVADEVGYQGTTTFDKTKPDGTPRKVLDVDKLHRLGWRHTTPLRKGIAIVCQEYLKSVDPNSGIRLKNQ